ncbi:MAG TPA: glutathione S-transferase N-terminal domain-containing protein, partial [Hyphomicrobiaceae bacterium]|nr:glutathione S-transferase N-terminal domain-containing protein [Hyphomicrobiaceae bacterium]
MTIQMFDLSCRDQRVFFSPYCWRSRMALKHKGLAFESIPWKFTDKASIATTNQGRVPVIVDGGTWVNDSWEIAAYLDKTYPDAPPLLNDKAAIATAKFVDAWCSYSVFPTLRPICVADVFRIVADEDRDYFRESREKMLGARLEELSTDPPAERNALLQALRPLEDMLRTAPFFGGESPAYADYIVFGTLMWPYTVCRDFPFEAGTSTAGWFNRLLDLNGGY